METDQKLAERCLSGDPEAWNILVRTHQKRIYNMAYRFTRRFDVAEELTQDVFMKIYQNLGSFRPEDGSLQNWLLRGENRNVKVKLQVQGNAVEVEYAPSAMSPCDIQGLVAKLTGALPKPARA